MFVIVSYCNTLPFQTWHKPVFVNVAPSVPPVVRVTSATPTTISIAWDEIPCLMRNGMIFRYVVSFCHASIIKCQSLTSVASVSREFSFDHLILRSSYNIAIRADSLDPVLHTPHLGPFSSTITADTSSPQGLLYNIIVTAQ